MDRFNAAISDCEADHGRVSMTMASTYFGLGFLVDLLGREKAGSGGGPVALVSAEGGSDRLWIEVS